MTPPLPLNAWLRYDVIARMLDRLGPVRSILEIGAGQGAVGARLAKRGRYVGVEPDPTSRATAQARLPHVVASLDDVEGEFDLVCAFEVLEHIEDDRGALGLWASRVAPGGALMLSVPGFQARYAAFDELVGHFRRYEPDDLAKLLLDAGLARPEVVAYGGPLGYALEAARNAVGRRRLARTSDDFAGRTSGSGRLLQPPDALGAVTAAVAAPFRLMQRPMTSRGTGLVAVARRERDADDHDV